MIVIVYEHLSNRYPVSTKRCICANQSVQSVRVCWATIVKDCACNKCGRSGIHTTWNSYFHRNKKNLKQQVNYLVSNTYVSCVSEKRWHGHLSIFERMAWECVKTVFYKTTAILSRLKASIVCLTVWYPLEMYGKG